MSRKVAVATPAAVDVDGPVTGDQFRARLMGALLECIVEQGYRDTTVADVVARARASRRSFYLAFATKDDCFEALMDATTAELMARLRGAVDPGADWTEQVRAAVGAFLEHVKATPGLALCWIREVHALGERGEAVARRSMTALADLVGQLSAGPQFAAAGLRPVPHDLAVVLLGGLRELTASVVERDGDLREIADTATAAALALVGSTRADRAPGRSSP